MEYKQLDLLDLISERHMQLRHELEVKWNETSEMKISNAEWHILAKIKQSTISMAELSRRVNHSRQATHKMLKNMKQKNLVVISDVPQNKKEKYIQLTPEAVTYYAQYEALKRELEANVQRAIGSQHYEQLQYVLQLKWD